MRLVQSTERRERDRQLEPYCRMISIGLARPSTPDDRRIVTAENVLRDARVRHPRVSHHIARTEAEGLEDMGLGFFGAANENLAQSDDGMGAGAISMQRQRMFTFGDALCGAPGEDVDKSE